MATNDNQRKIVDFVRHAEAVSKDEDPKRPLTKSGRLAAERLAAWAATANI